LVPSPLYTGERVRVRGSSWERTMRYVPRRSREAPHPALSPEYKGEGVQTRHPWD